MATLAIVVVTSLFFFLAGYVYALSRALKRSIRWALRYGLDGSFKMPSMDHFVGRENVSDRETFAIHTLIALKDLSPGPYVFFPRTTEGLRGILRLADQRMKLEAERGFKTVPIRKEREDFKKDD